LWFETKHATGLQPVFQVDSIAGLSRIWMFLSLRRAESGIHSLVATVSKVGRCLSYSQRIRGWFRDLVPGRVFVFPSPVA
jgi:hypothetical protein